jgi:hypothetical protein
VESFEEILRSGGRTNSLGRAGEVVTTVLSSPARLDELYDCVSADDAWVRMRAIDSLEKICRTRPEWIRPHVPDVLARLAHSDQPSIQWHVAQILAEVPLTEEQHVTAVAWLSSRLATTEVDWIVSVNAMRALLKLTGTGGAGSAEVADLVRTQTGHPSASVRRKAYAFLESLTGHGPSADAGSRPG